MTYFLQSCIDALSLGSLFALVSLGVGLVFGVLRLVNFAQGDFITLGAYALIAPSSATTAQLLLGAMPWPVAVAGVILVVVALALLSERVVFRPLRNADGSTLLLASFSLSFVINYLVLMVYGARPKGIDVGASLTSVIEVGGLRVSVLDVVTIAVTFALLAIIAFFMTRTKLGIQTRAAAEDFRMARMLGIRSNVIIPIAFAMSGVLAATVSLILVARTGMLMPRMGANLIMIGFVGTVIGGMGSLLGAVLGGFAVGVTSALLQIFLPEEMRPARDAFVFGAVILFLLVSPRGIIRLPSMKARV